MALLAASVLSNDAASSADLLAVARDDRGRLVYQEDERGNRIPDFSHCGYSGGNRRIPHLPVRARLAPAPGDDGRRIQAAIDRVAQLPLGEDGFRGAVLLEQGQFQVAGQLRLSASGVVLRGSGAGETTLVATGLGRRALIRIAGIDDRRPGITKPLAVLDEYVPVGATTLQLDSAHGLKTGDQVVVTRPSTSEWIKALGADAFGVGWKPGTRDIRWDRLVTHVDGDTITLDAPITTAIERRFGGATVESYHWPGRIANIGIEDLRMQSEHDADNPHDEEHAWFGVVIENVQNAWVRRAEFRRFAGGAVALWETAKWITVEDCISLEPISELGGYRRHTFFTQGQLTLFLRCWSEHGRHDFAVGHCAPGPNAFVHCQAAKARGESGPIESWATGVLYDNVRIDGAGLHLENRWIRPPGAGWSAANCLLWQCQATSMHVFRPPTANNWAIGVWAGFAGDGTFQARSDFVRPLSLYEHQLGERLGTAHAAHVGLGLVDPIGSTNPTIIEAAEFTEQSRKPARQLRDIIRAQWSSSPPPDGSDAAERNSREAALRYSADSPRNACGTLKLRNGWLVVDGRLKTGGRLSQGFWRGSIRPEEAPPFGPAITRFIPGRIGTGFTDRLDHLAERMRADGVAVFDHHYGLWYDRRRDDHTMVRQENGNVAPPFYEQPFARTARGQAWDGLSKYDLTRFNPWYWRRLRNFARLADEHGLVLFHQNYFQHNILEAGAHWADSPWRSVNNVNDTGFPEPPPYIGEKRIFIAEQFYDTTHPRRALHRGYIRQCLDSFAGCSNVIQMTSAEYSGPLEFTQFWLDTIIEWQREHGRDVLVALSAPKDVQDAILVDAERAPHIDVIDVRYWAYTAGGELYAPAGGQNLAPRQHLRKTRQRPGGFPAIVRAVREYRTRYPEKAVTYYADMHCPSGRDGWAVLIGGGSLPNVNLPDKLARVIPTLAPAEDIVIDRSAWCLANPQGELLLYTENIGETLRLKLPGGATSYRMHWIDPNTNEWSTSMTPANRPFRVRAQANVLWLEPAQAEK